MTHPLSPAGVAPPGGAARDTATISAAAVITPIAEDLASFTEALLAGRCAPATPSGLPPGVAPAALLDRFAPSRWADTALRDAPAMAARLPRLLRRASLPTVSGACVAARVVADAALPDGWGERAALVVAGGGLALAHQAEHARRFADGSGPLPSYALSHQDIDAVGAISELTGIRGEGWAVGGASAAGTLALIHGARAVEAGWVDHCLVVAPLAELSSVEIAAFRRSGAMLPALEESDDTACRPFDTTRAGFLYGQAAAAVLVERWSTAIRRGAPVLATLAGHGQRLDAARGTEPATVGQVRAMRGALCHAGLEPEDIGYVNAHGTGSRVGDAVELDSLREVFSGRATLRINSTKALLGHCLSSAGLVEAIATLVQLRSGRLHPMPYLKDPIDPGIGLVAGPAEEHRCTAALSNSFAFGGVSACLVLRVPDPVISQE